MRSPQLSVGLAFTCLLLTTAQAQERHKRLTTFGKAPEKQTNPGKAKDCRTDKDCPVEHTSCKEDRDGKDRCICADNTYPVRGFCQHTRKKRGYVPKGNSQTKEKEGCCENLFIPATQPFFPESNKSTPARPMFIPAKYIAIALREPCQSSSECIVNAECKINPNATTPAMMRTKVCLCMEDAVEEDHECNGCVRLETSRWAVFVLVLSSLVVAFQH